MQKIIKKHVLMPDRTDHAYACAQPFLDGMKQRP
jgi:hypothetical protein